MIFTWYYNLFLFSLSFIIISSTLSWIFGDTDFNIDADTDTDADGSTIFSFKGFIHFLFGFSITFMILSMIYDSFVWWHYIVALVIGILFMYLLYRLYKFVMKAEHYNNDNTIIDECDAMILNKVEDLQYVDDDMYEVMVFTPQGTRKISAFYKGVYKQPTFGVKMYVVSKNDKGYYIIKDKV